MYLLFVAIGEFHACEISHILYDEQHINVCTMIKNTTYRFSVLSIYRDMYVFGVLFRVRYECMCALLQVYGIGLCGVKKWHYVVDAHVYFVLWHYWAAGNIEDMSVVFRIISSICSTYNMCMF